MILSIDPGCDKWGVAVLTESGEVKYRQVFTVSQLEEKVQSLKKEYPIKVLVLGDGTGSNFFRQELSLFFARIEIVEEKNSTLEAREYYWQENPPSGWRKLLPISLQTPPKPIDDCAAVILGRRYISASS